MAAAWDSVPAVELVVALQGALEAVPEVLVGAGGAGGCFGGAGWC